MDYSKGIAKNPSLQSHIKTLYQLQVYYNITPKKLFSSHKLNNLFVPFVSSYVFLNQDDATKFAPTYIDYLIKEGVVDPSRIYLEGQQLNPTVIYITVVPLTILASVEDFDENDFKQILKG